MTAFWIAIGAMIIVLISLTIFKEIRSTKVYDTCGFCFRIVPEENIVRKKKKDGKTVTVCKDCAPQFP